MSAPNERRGWRVARPVLIAMLIGSAGLGCTGPIDRAGDDDPASGQSKPTQSDPTRPEDGQPVQTEVPEVSVAPASGTRLRARGLEVSVPRGWEDVTERKGVVLRASQLTNDDAPQVMVVTRDRASQTDVPMLRRRAKKELRRTGHTKIRVGDPDAEVDGIPASQVTAVKRGSQPPLAIERYDVRAGKQHWTITFAASNWANAEDRRRTVASIIASWAWT
jgi:hypothetical protein